MTVSKSVSEGGVYQTFYSIDPSLFREINTLVKGEGQNDFEEVTIEIVDAVSTDEA
jgi:type IV secretory pathway VirB10-like protein